MKSPTERNPHSLLIVLASLAILLVGLGFAALTAEPVDTTPPAAVGGAA